MFISNIMPLEMKVIVYQMKIQCIQRLIKSADLQFFAVSETSDHHGPFFFVCVCFLPTVLFLKNNGWIDMKCYE